MSYSRKTIFVCLIGLLVPFITRAQWVQTNGPGAGSVYSFAVSGTNLFAGTRQGGIFVTTDKGISWTKVNTGLTNTEVHSLALSGTNLFAGTYGGGVFLSSDKGASWALVNVGLTNGYLFSLVFSGGSLFAGGAGGVHRSVNNGATWTVSNTGLTDTEVRSIGVAGSNLFAGTFGGGVFLSLDNGASWTAVNAGLPKYVYDATKYAPVACLASSAQYLLAGTYGSGIYRSTNNGTTWTSANTGLASTDVNALVAMGTNLFAGTGGGVYRSTDNGASWTAFSVGLPVGCSIRSFAFSATDLILGTDYNGVWRRPLTDFLPISLVLVEGGTFPMGSTSGDPDEQPVHTVTVSSFYLDLKEVTVGEYRAFCTATGRTMPSAPTWGWVDTHPVVNVSWNDATAYAQWVGKRLPTEAEWEYAARGGKFNHGYTYSGSNTLDGVGWYTSNSGSRTNPVGGKGANELGLFDMSGNIWELCNDWYDAAYYGVSPATNPKGPVNGSKRVDRGGSWKNDPSACRVSDRTSFWQDSGLDDLGFRCAADPPPAPPVPYLSSPGNGVTGVAGSPTLAWNASTGATSYRVQLSTSATFATGAYDSSGISGTSHKVEWLSGATNYYWRVFAANANNLSDPSSAWSFATLTGPYLGSRFVIPGTFEAECYDAGGEGITYHDSDAVNQGVAKGSRCRTVEGVDIEACQDSEGGVFNVGWTARGEWTRYSVAVSQSGVYRMDARVASRVPFRFHLEIDGNPITGSLGNDGTGGWQNWVTLSETVTLPSGDHYLYLKMDGAGAGGDNGNYNRFRFTALAPTIPLRPTGLQATAVSGRQINLTWTDASDNEDGFKVERKGGGIDTFKVVAAPAPNTTSYQDTGLTPSTSYTYRVQAYNSAGSSDYSDTAVDTTQDRVITVTGPLAGVSWTVNTQQQVTWTSENVTGNVNISLSIDGGGSYPFALESAAVSAGIVTILVPDHPSTTCRVKVQSVSDTNVYRINPGDFTIASEIIPPQIALPAISGGGVGQAIDVTAQVTDNVSVASATLYYRAGGATSFTTVVMSVSSGSTYRGTIPATAVTSSGVDYLIKALDLARNEGRYPDSGWAHVQVVVAGEGLASGAAQPAGSEQKAYRLVSVPFEADNSSATAVLVDDLGAYDNTRWRFFELKADQSYAEYPNVSSMTPGKGFWLIVRESGKVIDSGPGKSVSTSSAYAIAVNAGWNLIGNPYLFPLPVEKLSWALSYPIALRSFEEMWVSALATVLEPFKGYALHASSATTLKVSGDLSAGSLPKPRMAPAVAPSWWVGIEAQCGEARDVDNVAMVSEGASRARDTLDLPEPPVIGEYVSVCFPHPEWGEQAGGSYCVDARPESNEGELWEFVVRTVSHDRVKLSFAGVDSAPQGKEVWLVDEAVHVRQDVRVHPSYEFPSPGEGNGRQFALIVGGKAEVEKLMANKGVVPASFTLLPNFPNPFNPRTTIAFGVPVSCQVRLSVYTVLGQEVAVLVDRTVEAGYHTAEFDGTPHASGVYFVRLQASGVAGGTTPLLKRIMLVK